jgi:ABC-type glycerol-3-phosphate transport system substrate-binding protein
LLIPFTEPLDLDWYDFARLLAEQDGAVYGLPFAGDALVLVYRPDVVLSPPKDWTTTISSPAPLLFPGASQASYLSLALYEAAGGVLLDPDGRPGLSTPVLSALLDFYAGAVDAGVMTAASVEIQNESASYESFRTGEVDLAVTWASNRLNDVSGNIAATALPTVSAVPYTLVTGWMWALSNPDTERARLSAELAAFLTAPEFLAAWTYAAGAIPPRASALAGWPAGVDAALASRLVLAAHPLPPLAVLETTGPALQAAVEAVLLGDLSPAEAAEAAALRVNGP